LQRRFPIDDVLLLSVDIRDEVAKFSEIAPKFHIIGPSNFGQKEPQISDRIFKSGSLFEHLAELGDDWPRDRGN